METCRADNSRQPRTKSALFRLPGLSHLPLRRFRAPVELWSILYLGLVVIGCSDVPSYPLRFERVERSSGTAYQAQADGTLGKDRTEFAFSITRSADVALVVAVSASMPGTQTRLIRSSGWTGESVACVPDNSGTTCYASMEKARPGNYSVITGRGTIASQQEVAVRVFAGVHGPGLVEFSDQGKSGQAENSRRAVP